MAKLTQGCLGLLGPVLKRHQLFKVFAFKRKTLGSIHRLVINRNYNERKQKLPLYEQEFLHSINKPDEFWAEAAEKITWTKKWNSVLDNTNEPFTKW